MVKGGKGVKSEKIFHDKKKIKRKWIRFRILPGSQIKPLLLSIQSNKLYNKVFYSVQVSYTSQICYCSPGILRVRFHMLAISDGLEN